MKITFTLNGKKITGDYGKTVLEIARENGIEIPNLCHAEGLSPYGACGICVAEAEGSKKLIRTCSAVAREGMVLSTETERAVHARKIALELIMSDHRGDCVAPCALRCPAHTDVQGYIKQIALGNYSEAVRIIKEKIPFPASIGRICPHPCEKDCRRNLVEEPLSIAYLKAFAADKDLESESPYMPETAKESGKTVSIIGGGPAGLSAAYYLRLSGHSVTVFDAMPEMGGMLRYGIPEYRLPKKVLSEEIRGFEKLGVLMKNNVRIGEHVTFDEIKNSSDAVLIAVGKWKSRRMGCAGEELSGVMGGIDFLRKAALCEEMSIGEKVAVIGCGNTAMDACRTALRLGAKKVFAIYRRTREEAPAEDLEIREAMEEGIEFRFLRDPAEITGSEGRVSGLVLRVMELGEADASGRRRPVPVEGKTEFLEADTVIAAIGQECDFSGIGGIETDSRGRIIFDGKDYSTGEKGVFAAGDVIGKGELIAIEAVAQGGIAAKSIDAFLRGENFENAEPYFSKTNPEKKDFSGRERIPRAEMSVLDPEERKSCFDEVIKGFSEEEARAEAGRCLECGCHDFADCRLIRLANRERIFPGRFSGRIHDSYKEKRLVSIERDQGKCMLCGLCVRICRDEVKKGILGFYGRGFETGIKPEFSDPKVTVFCRECGKCAGICPTGALKIIK